MILPLLLGAALGADIAAAPETPKAYMERLYASYGDPAFNPLRDPARYFAPELVSALNEDSHLADGEVGYVEGDPVCQCQDPAGIRATVASVTQSGPGKAEVRVLIGLTGYQARPATFTLVLTKSGWRIADVSSPDEPSFLRGVEESNRKQRKNH